MKIETPVEFLHWARPDGPWTLTAIIPDGAIETATFTDPDEVTAWVKQRDGKKNLYWAPNPLRRAMKSKAKKSDVAALEWLHVDVDDPSPRALALIREHDPTVIINSGNGFNALWRLTEPVAVSEEWPVERLEGYNRHLENLLSGDHCHNLDRILRLPFTVNLPNEKKRKRGKVEVMSGLVLHDGPVRPLSDFEGAKEGPGEQTDPPMGDNHPSLPEALPNVNVDELPVSDETKRLIRSGDASAFKGDRSTLVFKVAVDLCRAKVEREVIGAVLLDPGLGVSAHCLSKGYQARRAAERAINSAHVAVTTDFERGSRGVIKRDVPQNIRLALIKLNVDLKFDELNQLILINGKMVERDSDITNLRVRVADQFSFLPTKDLFYDVVTETAEQAPFHPIKEYLDGLTWDGEKRIDDWLHLYLSAADNEYTQAVGRLWLVAAVRRVREPGCKFDEMLVLEGEQGSDKSTALEVLAGGPDWFTDDLPFKQDSKVFIERCAGKWIIEFSEMSGIKKQQVEAVKAMLSRSVDTSRLAYGRVTKHVKRACVFAGTTNDKHYLKDPTGDRRFWPVQTGEIDIEDLKRDRDQLWAEAAHVEEAKEPIRLDQKLWEAAAEEQRKRRGKDPWEEILDDIKELSTGPTKIRASDVWAALGVDRGYRTQVHFDRAIIIMERYGFVHGDRANIGGKTAVAYTKDKDEGAMRAVKWVTLSDGGHWRASTLVEKPVEPTIPGTEDDDPGPQPDGR